MTNHKITGIKAGNPLLLGGNRILSGYNFAVEAPEDAEVTLLLYKKKSKTPTQEIPLGEEYRTGKVYAVMLPEFSAEDYEYNFQINGKIFLDPWTYSIRGREHFGAASNENPHHVRCGLLSEKTYDWENDKNPDMSYKDMVLYKLHVRGYTKTVGKTVAKKGTFRGLLDMIPYWTELGINAIELMPAYEFMEVAPAAQKEGLISERRKEGQVNYWGYLQGYYFAPKRSYSSGSEPEAEFRDLVKALHKAGIACIMEMYFTKETSPLLVLRTLQFWKLFYHVDGFHIFGEGVPLNLVLRDGILSETKLMVPGFDPGKVYGESLPAKRNLAEYHSGFQQDMRRFLKSDEDMVPGAVFHIKNNPASHGVIHYMASQDGFTMNDMVTYNYKHNETNGENNQDGCNYNYSWNCGIEGPSRKLSVRQIRERQMKNAFLMVLLSQGVPMIYGGDEIANSQGGNNNAYCQDNAVGWIDWKGQKKNERLFAFVQKAIAFRKEHPVLHQEKELKGFDYLTKGFPDISFHGERAWYSGNDNTCRLLGVMYCGAYAKKENGDCDDSIYVAYNFHWESRQIALPNLPDKKKWRKVIDTGNISENGFLEEQEEFEKKLEIGPRTIVVLLAK